MMNGTYYAPDGGEGGATESETPAPETPTQPIQGEEKPATFEDWLKSQDETTAGLINNHISGLKSALDSERGERKKLAGELKKAAGNLEAGSEARKQLEETSGRLESMERQASFYETAHSAGVADLRAAYLIAQDRELINQKGQVDLEGLKSAAPYLFAQPKSVPAGNAGAGVGQPPPRAVGMNDLIRQAAGRK